MQITFKLGWAGVLCTVFTHFGDFDMYMLMFGANTPPQYKNQFWGNRVIQKNTNYWADLDATINFAENMRGNKFFT